MEQVTLDPRVGGGFEIAERCGSDLVRHFCEYREIDPPRRLAFDFWTSFSAERTRVTVAVEPEDEGSRLTLRHDRVWAEWADKTRHGWTMILDRLDRGLNKNALP